MAATAVNGDTIRLLEECNAGSKMATNSMEQIQTYVRSKELKDLLHRYNEKHIQLGEDIHRLLREAGEPDKDPGSIAKAYSWISSQIKLKMDSSEKEAASILMDGCHMGIKSLSEYKNKYCGADAKAVDLCERLRRLEKQMADDLEPFL